MSFSTRSLILCLAAFAQTSIAGYNLVDNYTPDNFFDQFSFFTEPDPTNGFVQYVDQGTAQSGGLISQNGGSVRMGVDSTNSAPNGRSSVRITSNKIYNHGLIILDASHMPVGCGTWPAFWTVGPDWPSHGEIDIIEGVNSQSSNAMTLHTGPGCSITDNGKFTGSISTDNCDVNAYGQPNNAGCSIDTPDTRTYGAGFNAGQGGVYATLWNSNKISIYFFPRGSIPADITSGNPKPHTWGKPYSSFQGSCDIDNFFSSQQIVFDTTFCGDWAGNAWGSDSTCSAKASSCEDYVANNPTAFQDAYWEINSLKVYQTNKGSSANAPKPDLAYTSGGPTGVVTSLPAAITSEAPIPITSQDVSTTFMVSTTAAAPWSSAAWSSAPVWTSSAAAWDSSAAWSSAAPTASPSWVQSDAWAAAAAATKAAPSSSVVPLQASWFPDGSSTGGIPTTAVDTGYGYGYKKERRHARHIESHKRSAHGSRRSRFTLW